MREPNRKKITLLSAGGALTLFTYLMVHQISSALPHWETAAFTFNFAYFLGISLGYFFTPRIKLEWLPVLFPVTLVAQMALLFFASVVFFFVETSLSQGLGLAASSLLPRWGAIAAIFVLLLGAGTPLFAMVLPKSVEGQFQDPMPLHTAYTWEISGALIGLISLPLASWVGHWMLILVYSLFFFGMVWGLNLSSRVQAVVAGLALFWVSGFNTIDRQVGVWSHRLRAPQRRYASLVEVKYTPYHKIEVLETAEKSKFLYLSGKRQFGEGSHHIYSYLVSEFPARILAKRPRVLVLGCGSMSTVGRIAPLAEHIRIVDIDPEVFKTSRLHFPQFNRLESFSNWTFHADDAKHFLANDAEVYDLIIHDIPPANSRQIALTYTREFFELVRKRLSPQGLFSIAALDTTDNKREYGRRVLATLQSVFANVSAFRYRGSLYTYSTDSPKPIEGAQMLKVFEENLDPAQKNEWFQGRPDVLLSREIREVAHGYAPVTNNNPGELVYD